MKRLTLLVGTMLLGGGCGEAPPGPKDTLPKEIDAAYTAMAEAAAQAADVDSFQKTLHEGGTRVVALYSKANALPKKQQVDLEAIIEPITKEGGKRVDRAIEEFHARMTKGPNPTVVIDTSLGPIKAELYDRLAPLTVQNFLAYVEARHYDGTIFHRVIPDFMIQGGGFLPGMKQKKTREPIFNEAGNLLPNRAGTLAMARTSDPNSATDQFFINVKDNESLNRRKAQDKVGYAAFGKVIEGMDVVNKIKDVKTANMGAHEAVPTTDVVIKSIRRAEAK